LLILRNVINYDPPREFSSYLHRAGRSCRGVDQSGSVISLLIKKKDRQFAQFLVGNLQKKKVEVPRELSKLAGKQGRFKGILVKRNDEEMKIKRQLGRGNIFF
jgi:superfamily II DNA/RNA helicase